MMDDLRRLIVDWIKANGMKRHWLLNVFQYLISHGASPEDAIRALNDFVDEAIVMKKRPKLYVVENDRPPVGT
jgi:hypothetical protein